MIKVFVTGGSGVLGSRLVEHLSESYEVYAPGSVVCNVLNELQVLREVTTFNPNILIHLAAFVDTYGCELDKSKALDVNVLGTINVVKACNQQNCKLVYVSSEYVFSGDRGDYSVYDRLDPINVYGKTKAAAEYIVSTANTYQIIRAPFIKRVHPQVFVDQYCTRYFLDEAVERIALTALNNNSRIVQIAPEKDTLYNTYVKKGYQPQPVYMTSDQSKIIPKDTSLINQSL